MCATPPFGKRVTKRTPDIGVQEQPEVFRVPPTPPMLISFGLVVPDLAGTEVPDAQRRLVAALKVMGDGGGTSPANCDSVPTGQSQTRGFWTTASIVGCQVGCQGRVLSDVRMGQRLLDQQKQLLRGWDSNPQPTD